MTEVRALAQRARQNEKLAAVGTLAAGVAHEIRNPLSSIRGFAHYLEHRLTDRPQESEYASVMVREIDRINHVVSNLLTLARPAHIEKTQVSPEHLLDHVLTLVAGEAASQAVTLNREAAEPGQPVMADESLMTQAMLNLVLNSLQAVAGGASIEVGAKTAASNQLVLWVEDDGPGIDAATRQRMFDPFFTTRSGGTGLGLAIVQQIVDQHQGRIELHCPPPAKPHGCRIEIYLPRE
jgi:two-component system sensor histidine kinase HydH